LVGGIGVEEDASLMNKAGHRLNMPTYTGLGERAHLANPPSGSIQPTAACSMPQTNIAQPLPLPTSPH
jgi:hypothetical protein